MLRYIQASSFIFFGNPNPDCNFNYAKNNKGENKSPCTNSKSSYQLSSNRYLCIEYTYSQCSPYATNSMNGNCANRIIYLYPVKENNRENHQSPSHSTNYYCIEHPHLICSSCNPNQTSKNTI